MMPIFTAAFLRPRVSADASGLDPEDVNTTARACYVDSAALLLT